MTNPNNKRKNNKNTKHYNKAKANKRKDRGRSTGETPQREVKKANEMMTTGSFVNGFFLPVEDDHAPDVSPEGVAVGAGVAGEGVAGEDIGEGVVGLEGGASAEGGALVDDSSSQRSSVADANVVGQDDTVPTPGGGRGTTAPGTGSEAKGQDDTVPGRQAQVATDTQVLLHEAAKKAKSAPRGPLVGPVKFFTKKQAQQFNKQNRQHHNLSNHADNNQQQDTLQQPIN